MSIKKTATLIGATGLVGNQLLKILLENDVFSTVRIIVRHPIKGFTHPKLDIRIISFDDETAFKDAIGNSNVVFSCIGTTMKNVSGNKELYKKIDYDITVHAAQFAKEQGCNHFIFISSVGANSKSSNFYLNLKGCIEDAVIATEIENIAIIQPGFIEGNRKVKRPAERVMKIILPLLKYFIPSKYNIIHSEAIAKAMYQLSLYPPKGVFRYQNKQIEVLAKNTFF